MRLQPRLPLLAVTVAGATGAAQPPLASGARCLSTDGARESRRKGSTGRLSAADGTALAADCALFPPIGRLPQPADNYPKQRQPSHS
jgi:hypothetical protein